MRSLQKLADTKGAWLGLGVAVGFKGYEIARFSFLGWGLTAPTWQTTPRLGHLWCVIAGEVWWSGGDGNKMLRYISGKKCEGDGATKTSIKYLEVNWRIGWGGW